MRFSYCLAFALCFFASWDRADAAQLLLDGFSTSQSMYVSSASTTAKSTITGLDILGGERDVSVTILSGGSGLTAKSSPWNDGEFQFNSGAAVRGRCDIVWDGVDGDPNTIDYNGLGGIDLNKFGPLLEIKDLVSDHAARLIIRMYDASDLTGQTWCEAVWDGLTFPGNQNLQFFASDFSAAGPSGTADLSNIGAICLTIDGSNRPSLDLAFSSIYFVPEPPVKIALAVAMSGIFVLTSARRKR